MKLEDMTVRQVFEMCNNQVGCMRCEFIAECEKVFGIFAPAEWDMCVDAEVE